MAVRVGLSSLAEGLHTMMEDGAKRESLTRRRGEVLRELSWDEPLAQTEQLYEALIGGAGR